MSPAQTGLRSPVVCGLLTFAPWLLTLLAYLATPHHPGCKRLHLTFSPSWAAKSLLLFDEIDHSDHNI